MQKVIDVYKFELSKFMFKYHTKSLPEIFDHYFLPVELAHNYNTSVNLTTINISILYIRTNSGKNSIKFFGVQLWNQIGYLVSLNLVRFKNSKKSTATSC